MQPIQARRFCDLRVHSEQQNERSAHFMCSTHAMYVKQTYWSHSAKATSMLSLSSSSDLKEEDEQGVEIAFTRELSSFQIKPETIISPPLQSGDAPLVDSLLSYTE